MTCESSHNGAHYCANCNAVWHDIEPTTTPPTVPGVYWALPKHASGPMYNLPPIEWEVVDVSDWGEGELVAWATGWDVQAPLSDFTHWAGPIEAPPLPEKIEVTRTLPEKVIEPKAPIMTRGKESIDLALAEPVVVRRTVTEAERASRSLGPITFTVKLVGPLIPLPEVRAFGWCSQEQKRTEASEWGICKDCGHPLEMEED